RRCSPSEDRAHATAELPDRERLRDVVVRTELEADDLVELVVARREHHDRHRAARAQPLAHLEPVEAGQHHAEDDEVDVLGVELRQRLVPVACLDNAVPVALKRIGQELLNGLLVVDEQNGGWIRHQEPTGGRAYYSPAIATPAPPSRPRRRRRGSAERPVNSRLYRGTWLLVGIPLLIAAFSVGHPSPLPAPTTPTTLFDGSSAVATAQELTRLYPDRAPGSAGSLGATRWLIDKMKLYSYTPQVDTFTATIPGLGRKTMRNVSFTI